MALGSWRTARTGCGRRDEKVGQEHITFQWVTAMVVDPAALRSSVEMPTQGHRKLLMALAHREAIVGYDAVKQQGAIILGTVRRPASVPRVWALSMSPMTAERAHAGAQVGGTDRRRVYGKTGLPDPKAPLAFGVHRRC